MNGGSRGHDRSSLLIVVVVVVLVVVELGKHDLHLLFVWGKKPWFYQQSAFGDKGVLVVIVLVVVVRIICQ